MERVAREKLALTVPPIAVAQAVQAAPMDLA